jgi:streptogramin lyase
VKVAALFSIFGLLFGLPAWAHPGSGLAVDAQGRVFFTAGSMIVMLETNGTARAIVHDAKNEKFYQLHHIQRAPDGAWLTASDIGDAIWRFTPEGKLSRFYPPQNEDRPLPVGSGGDPFAVDREGNVYAVNSRRGQFTQVLRITADGRVRVLAGGDWGFADGQGDEAKFGDLHGGSMIVAQDGALLLTDDYARVRRLDANGRVTTMAGGATRGSADGPGAEARFNGATGLAVDAQGNVLVVESSGRIRRIDRNGVVSTLAGSGEGGSRDGPLLEATFAGPTGITVGPTGDIFVLETGSHRIRKISGSRVTTIHQGLPKSP